MRQEKMKFKMLFYKVVGLLSVIVFQACDVDTESNLSGTTGTYNPSEPDGYIQAVHLDSDFQADAEEDQLEIYLHKLSNTEENIEYQKVEFKSVVFTIESQHVNSNLQFEMKNNAYEKLITPILYSLEIELKVGSKCFVKGFYFGSKKLPIKCETGAIAKVENQR